MADEVLVRLRVFRGRGKLTPPQVRAVLDGINEELRDPASEVSNETEELGLQVADLKLEHEPPAFIAEAFIITFVVGPFVGGVAASAGKLFFDKVIKRRIDRVSDGAVTEAEPVVDKSEKD